MQINRTALSALSLILVSSFASGQSAADENGAPLSAIDWLSDSISIPAATPKTKDDIPAATHVPEVMVAPLDVPVVDRFGLIDARNLGLPANLWGGSAAGDLATLIHAIPPVEQPSLRHFLASLLLARLDPPIDAIADDSLFLARLDKLLDLAQLDAAHNLIQQAGAPEPKRFRRQFDIALLTSTETEACRTIETTPDLSPTFPVRIFCLARNGEFDVAALTLGTAEALGILSEEEDQLLLHFLDPDLFEDDPIPPPPAQISPLMFRLYEAIGERPTTETLPVAFAAADLGQTVGWKARLRAAERLASVGALAPDRFRTIFTERKPAASGGVWTRVAAIQALERAIQKNDRNRIIETLPPACDAAVSGGDAPSLASWFLDVAKSAEIETPAHHALFEIAVTGDDPDFAAQLAASSIEDQTVLAVLRGRPFDMRSTTPLAQAIRQSLSGLPPGETYRSFMDQGRNGEALLLAITALADGVESDPNSIRDALSFLNAFGLQDLARRTAVELLLEDSRI